MTRDTILAELKAERDRLGAAIAALEGVGRRRGRPPRTAYAPRKRRTMSAAARKRISEAMKAAWAARKKVR